MNKSSNKFEFISKNKSCKNTKTISFCYIHKSILFDQCETMPKVSSIDFTTNFYLKYIWRLNSIIFIAFDILFGQKY